MAVGSPLPSSQPAQPGCLSFLPGAMWHLKASARGLALFFFSLVVIALLAKPNEAAFVLALEGRWPGFMSAALPGDPEQKRAFSAGEKRAAPASLGMPRAPGQLRCPETFADAVFAAGTESSRGPGGVGWHLSGLGWQGRCATLREHPHCESHSWHGHGAALKGHFTAQAAAAHEKGIVGERVWLGSSWRWQSVAAS